MATETGATSASAYCRVRSMTELLAAPLSPEDQTVQSMPDVSPTKWHRAHTTWFFETFVLGPFARSYREADAAYGYLFNSYYDALGPRHARPERGIITRPGVAEVGAYREHVDRALTGLLVHDLPEQALGFVELGMQHEQQHQELLVMDIKHVLSRNPLFPRYGALPWNYSGPVGWRSWLPHEGGVVEVGHSGAGFAFDNEGPRHEVLLRPFELATDLITCGGWLEFMADGGYHRPELWMSDGWHAVQGGGWRSPEYWHERDGDWAVFDLDGLAPVDSDAPVAHVSWYEADAFTRWAGARLPLEAEWETVAPGPEEPDAYGWYGVAWQWTASGYAAYPGFRPAAGAVGEYNGKFMVNQQVLRGSSVATPPGHARRSYRNFFGPASRWAFTGVRLARDLD